jgi:Ca-activated chloride channel family protein
MHILKRVHFNNDKVDAGDINSGHMVTAIYEIALVGSEGTVLNEYELRYGDESMVLEGKIAAILTNMPFITKVGIEMVL